MTSGGNMRRGQIVSDDLRIGPYRIVKGHVEARTYRVFVLDMRRDRGDRNVYRATGLGWTRAERENARTWIREQIARENPAAPAATTPEEESMAGKPDPKPTSRKATSGRKSKTATQASRKSQQAQSKAQKAPEPVVELPATDAQIPTGADLAADLRDRISAAIDGVEFSEGKPGRYFHVRRDGKTIAVVNPNRKDVRFLIRDADADGGYAKHKVASETDVAAAIEALVARAS